MVRGAVPMMALRKTALLLLLLALGVFAEEEPLAEAEAILNAAAEEPAAEAASEAEDPEAAAKAQEYLNSANDLQDKLGQLKALLDAKGADADPQLKERLAGLEKQLGSLGLGSLTGSAAGSSPELTEFLSACVAMTVKRVGLQRPSTLSALSRVADGKMSREDAKQNDVWRMVATCIGQFTEDEFEQYKAGQVASLPKSYVELAKKPEAEGAVGELDDSVWNELKTIAGGLVKELTAGKEAPPLFYGTIALIPFGLAMAFLAKKFFDMTKRHEDQDKKKKNKADSGSGKKSR